MRFLSALLLLATATHAFAQPAPKPIEIKVVVVNMFEAGETPATGPASISIGSSANIWTPCYPSRRATTIFASTRVPACSGF